MTGNPFADGQRPYRARDAAAFLGRLAARTLSIMIASLCVAWVAFPQTREPIGAVTKMFMEREAYLMHEMYVAVHHRFWPEECADDRDCGAGEVCADSGRCICSADASCDEQDVRADGWTNDWTDWKMARPLSLAPFCPDPYMVRIRWSGADFPPAPDDCAVLIPVMEYRSMPVHVIRVDRFIGD